MSLITLGLNAKIFLATSARTSWASAANSSGIYVSAAPSMSEFDIVRTVKVTQNYAKADFNIRRSKTKLVGLSLEELMFDVEFPYYPSDPNFQTVRNAYIGGSTLGIAVMDGPLVSGAVGRWLDAVVTEFPMDEPIDKEIMVNCKLEPTISAVPPEWVQVT